MAEIVEAYVRSSAEVFTDPDTPSGCFMVCASAALSSASDDVAQMLRRKHHAQEAALKACFDRKVQQGELLAKTDTTLLAKYVICTIEGMSVQAPRRGKPERSAAVAGGVDAGVATAQPDWQ